MRTPTPDGARTTRARSWAASRGRSSPDPEQERFEARYREKNPTRNILGSIASLGGIPSPYGPNSKSYREYWKAVRAGPTLDAELALNLR